MNRTLTVLLLVLSVLFIIPACDREQLFDQKLYLPKGDVEKGKQAFIDMYCFRCHTVTGVELPALQYETSIAFNLGGEVSHLKSYSELVTSITNPTHIVSEKYLMALDEIEKAEKIESPMPSFNDEMTVSQLIDLITFLDSRYQALVPYYKGAPYGYAPSL